MPVLAILCKRYPGSDRAPASWPFGRAALQVDAEVIFGERAEAGVLHGVRATEEGWEPCALRPDVALDRFPSQSQPAAYAELLHALPASPIFNPPPLTALLRDKLRTQHVLHDLGMPEVTADARVFEDFLPGFCKPRFGSFGRGIWRAITPPPAAPGRILQRAILPPEGFAGVALRVLVQRTPEGIHVCPPVARFHRTECVVNRASGAEVAACADLFPSALASTLMLARRVMERFPEAIELGVDAVLDPDHHPHLIEVNSRPRGRLAALTSLDDARFGPAHEAACLRPLETALAWA